MITLLCQIKIDEAWCRRFCASLLAFMGMIGNPAVVVAQPVKTPHVEAELISRMAAAAPGQPIEAALRLNIIPHWHTYWKNPGDSGLPTKLKWDLPPGFTASDIVWPAPMKLPFGPLLNFGYENEVMHLVTITPPANLKAGGEVVLKAKAEWLVCKDVCIPEEAMLTLKLPVVAASPLVDARWEKSFASAKAQLPSTTLNDVTATIDGTTLLIRGKAALGATDDLAFFPHREDVIANAAKQTLTKSADGFALTVMMAEPINKELKILDGVLVANKNFAAPIGMKAVTIAAPVAYEKLPAGFAPATATSANTSNSAPVQAKLPETPRSDLTLWAALGFALLGGLILNLMPCVFPVLGIKVMGFVDAAHGDNAILRRQGIAFFVGVFVSFMVLAGLMLALRAAGQSIGWGFQLQEPAFVAVLAVLFFLMALNLSGVFEIGTSLQAKAGDAEMRAHVAQRNPLFGAFASGVLATVVATPCMAPGLGASVGFTLGQSTPIALMIFAAIAVGLALPIVLLSFFPAWLRALPKPGAWMETFKQFMAFPLYATVVWLIWVLGAQTGNDGVAKILVALTVFALAAWVYGRWQVAKPLMAVTVSVALVIVGAYTAWLGATTESVETANTSSAAPTTGNANAAADWIPFSPEKITSLRAEGKAVFVDFTASWCITCQVNKRVALNQADVVARMKASNVVRMKADWTKKDPIITEALASFGRNGLPLNVIYPAVGEPEILPEVLTPSIVIAAVDRAVPVKTAAR